eukprot:tig00000903_g5500.t1
MAAQAERKSARRAQKAAAATAEGAKPASPPVALDRVDASLAAVLLITAVALGGVHVYAFAFAASTAGPVPLLYTEFHRLAALADGLLAVVCVALAVQTWTGRRAPSSGTRRVLSGKLPVMAAGALLARVVLFAQYDARAVLPLGAGPYALHLFLELWCLFAAATAVNRYRLVCAVLFQAPAPSDKDDEAGAKARASFTARASRLSFVFLSGSLAVGAFCLAFRAPRPRDPAVTGAEGEAAAMLPAVLLAADLAPALDGFCVLAGIISSRLLRSRPARASSPASSSPIPLLASCVGAGSFGYAGVHHLAFFVFAAAADPRLEMAAHLVPPFFLLSCAATVAAVHLLAQKFVFR